jgi:regulator of protease activity HflC (stomatin/prohibitin superfamily)
MNLIVLSVLIPTAMVLLLVGSSVRLVRQHEQGIVFRSGRRLPGNRGPGLTFIVPLADRMVKVSMQTVVHTIPAQGVITRDNVTLTVDAVVYFAVIDPVKAIVNVQNYHNAVSQVTRTSLRSVIGRADLDTLLSNREQINAELKAVIDGPTEQPWGLHIERVEITDISLPRAAEAQRERRARVIAADGEFHACTRLADTAPAPCN